MIKKNSMCLLLSFLLTCLFASPGVAETGDFAMGAKASTLGLGVEGNVGLLPRLKFRTGVNLFYFSLDADTSNIDYNVEVDLVSFPVVLDLHPFRDSGFRISAGVLINYNHADLEGVSKNGYKINGTVYSAEQLGTLSGDVDFNKISPYVGIGWETSAGKTKGWSFSCDLGVAYHGKADVELKASSPLNGDPIFQKALAKEEQEIEDNLADYQFYPVVSIGVTYKF